MNVDTTGIANFDEYLAQLSNLNGSLVSTLFNDAPQLAALPVVDMVRLFERLGELNVSDAAIHELRGEIQKGKRRKTNKTTEETVSERIKRDLAKWGYAGLWLNDMDESIWLDDARFTDVHRAQLRMVARNADYARQGLLGALDDAIIAIAAERRRHPVRDYLTALKWDGGDHIAALARHFQDSHEPITYPDGTRRSVFHAALLRWLVGAVAKQMGDENAARSNFILVLAGAQDAGKSFFARYMCPLSLYFVERHITIGDKDCSLQRTRAMVWEVMELGATTRRADVEALKAHITQAIVKERAAYGRYDTVRPAVASYIGTVNPDGGGFLSDTTGNRRFAVAEITAIDWAYSNTVSIDQVWAQAVHVWSTAPGAYRFEPAESAALAGNADAQMEPDIFADAIARTFNIDAERTDWRCTSTEVLEVLRTYAGISRGHDKAQGKEVARALRKHWGIECKRTNGATVYCGLQNKAAG